MTDDRLYYRSTLEHGVLEILLPRLLSQVEAEELEQLLGLIVAQARRRVRLALLPAPARLHFPGSDPD